MTRESSAISANELLTPSQSPDSLLDLTDEQRLRLTDVLDRYLSSLEHDAPLDQAAVLAAYPDLADSLRTYFRSLEDLHDMAAGFGGGTPEKETDDSPETGQQRIGDFELLREIGRGGMGVVYEARQISLDRLVAIKILPFASVLDSRQIARFKHEAQAAAQLHHPHIVPVFAVGVERGVHYYAMQLVNGQPLDAFLGDLRNSKQRPPRDHFATIADWIRQAADALHTAHEFGIVHRDVKPSNLLLDTRSQLWVTDFGLARIQHNASLTRTGDLVGTLRYMSPEQAAGRMLLVDHRSDVYSLGATLYELATRCPAYADEPSTSVLRKIESQDPVLPRKLRPEIPLDLENIIRKAMARERDDRYATAADFAADLGRFLNDQPTIARAPSVAERLVRFSRRNAKAMAATISLLLLAVAGLSISAFLIALEKQNTIHQMQRADRYAKDARAVLDRFGRQLAERLADVSGAEQVRRDLLLEASKYYRNFIRDAQHDSTLRTELALAYGRLATLLDEVGSRDEAIAAHQQAVTFLAETNDQRQLALARNNLALAFQRQGNLGGAAEQLSAAITLQQDLLADSPQPSARAIELATSFSNQGLVQQALEQPTLAEASFQAAIQLLQQRLDANSTDAEVLRPLAAAYNNLAGLKQEQPAKAIDLHRQALRIQQQAARRNPADERLQRELALTHFNLASISSRLKLWSNAADEYQQASELQAKLVAHSPANLTYRRDLAISYNNLGLVHSRTQQPDNAEQAFVKSIEVQRPLIATAQATADDYSKLASSLSNYGVVLGKLGHHEQATAALAHAISLQQTAIELQPETVRFRNLLARHQSLHSSLVATADLVIKP
ncbi:protein kinase [Anatilimnocola sp. NA78]|uniref:serine/threonine protein kinase n=1 Tax=Anatilimnocola sp. NA78 TaxID=3415683 RepID=UPI003CE454FF